MIKVANGIQLYEEFDLEQIYSNYCIIFYHIGCIYIAILDEQFKIKYTYIYLKPLKLIPSKIQKLIFTNNRNLLNIYSYKKEPKCFKNFQQYSVWLNEASKEIKIIDMSRFISFEMVELKSNSELLNIQTIQKWWQLKQPSMKYIITNQLLIYNFYNYVLYLLSKNSISIQKETLKLYYENKKPSQQLTIDLNDNRCKHQYNSINFYKIRKAQDKWNYIKSEPNKALYKIDFKSSYIQILTYILEIKIQGDLYSFLGKELSFPDDYKRDEIKQKIFKILFSNQIKKHLNVEFFNKAYLLSLYLQEEYKQKGYIQSLISQKKIRLENNQIFNRSKLFNMFIMSLETQLYLGILYQLLIINKEKIKPIIFIYDSIIMNVNVEFCLKQIYLIQQILTLNGIFNLSRYIGDKLNMLEKI